MYFNFCTSYTKSYSYHLSVVLTILLFQNGLDIRDNLI